MFRSVFRNRLVEFLDYSPDSCVLLVPSTRDILSNHAVFPQPEFERALYSHPVRTCISIVSQRPHTDQMFQYAAHTHASESGAVHPERGALRGV